MAMFDIGQPPINLGEPRVLFGRRQRVVKRGAVHLIIEILEKALSLEVIQVHLDSISE